MSLILGIVCYVTDWYKVHMITIGFSDWSIIIMMTLMKIQGFNQGYQVIKSPRQLSQLVDNCSRISFSFLGNNCWLDRSSFWTLSLYNYRKLDRVTVRYLSVVHAYAYACNTIVMHHYNIILIENDIYGILNSSPGWLPISFSAVPDVCLWN